MEDFDYSVSNINDSIILFLLSNFHDKKIRVFELIRMLYFIDLTAVEVTGAPITSFSYVKKTYLDILELESTLLNFVDLEEDEHKYHEEDTRICKLKKEYLNIKSGNIFENLTMDIDNIPDKLTRISILERTLALWEMECKDIFSSPKYLLYPYHTVPYSSSKIGDTIPLPFCYLLSNGLTVLLGKNSGIDKLITLNQLRK